MLYIPTKEWVVLFLGKISLACDQKMEGLEILQKIFLFLNNTKSAYFKEKKIKFATFKP